MVDFPEFVDLINLVNQNVDLFILPFQLELLIIILCHLLLQIEQLQVLLDHFIFEVQLLARHVDYGLQLFLIVKEALLLHASDSAMEPVFYLVVSASREEVCNHTSLRTVFLITLENLLVFLSRSFLLFDFWIE